MEHLVFVACDPLRWSKPFDYGTQYYPIMENQMENKMENEMETRII